MPSKSSALPEDSPPEIKLSEIYLYRHYNSEYLVRVVQVSARSLQVYCVVVKTLKASLWPHITTTSPILVDKRDLIPASSLAAALFDTGGYKNV